MKYTTTDGKEYYKPDMYSCCRLDTAGNHEWGCPNDDSFIGSMSDEEAKIAMVKIKDFKLRFDKDYKDRERIWGKQNV